ncbi:MAG TPA: LytTR family DNA-binding domain-containing protein, partial [Gammaproteobacteria bacterium]|nr:LytTR family DNA-binding domain-containing protein [Gammaproteobacteria bacterium]
FNEFAVPAFEVRAVDYLLKPFDHERLKQALARVRERLDAPQADAAAAKQLTRFAVKSVGKTIFVGVDDVDWVETAGNYLCLHAGHETHLIRETMSRLESQLDPQRFARIHRSAIVRLDRIKSMQPLFNGDRCVTLHDGTQLTMSRSYRDKIDTMLGA